MGPRDGEIIENYPDDFPCPSCLVLGWIGGKPLHLVAAENIDENEMIVVTVYVPDPNQWEADMKGRKL